MIGKGCVHTLGLTLSLHTRAKMKEKVTMLKRKNEPNNWQEKNNNQKMKNTLQQQRQGKSETNRKKKQEMITLLKWVFQTGKE